MTRCRTVFCRIIFGSGLALLAAGPPQNGHAAPFAAVYDVYWAGLPAGRIRLGIGADRGHYRDEIAIRTEGLPHLVTRFRGVATAEGRLAPQRPAEPQRYDAVYDLRKRRDREISMRFVARGGASVAEPGPGATDHDSPIAEAFRRNAVDPLSAYERIREALRAALDGGPESFTVPVYDGARRFDVLGRLLPKSDGSTHTLKVLFTMRPIAGFKGAPRNGGDPDSAPRPTRMTFSDDARLLPLSATASVYWLPLVVQLDHICTQPEACGL